MPGWPFTPIVFSLSCLLFRSTPSPSEKLEIQPLTEDRWAIVAKRTLCALPVSIDTIGHEIDAEKCQAYRLFYGPSELRRPFARQRPYRISSCPSLSLSRILSSPRSSNPREEDRSS